LAQGRELRAARALAARLQRALRPPHRRDRGRARAGARRGRRPPRARRRPRDGRRRGRAGGRAGRRRAPLARLRELRPVRELRAPRRGVPAPCTELGGVRKGELEGRLLTLVTLGLVAFGLVMVYSATSGSAAISDR